MSRQQGDWVPCADYGNLTTISGGASGVGTLGGSILVRHGVTSDTLEGLSAPQVAVMEQSDDLMVHRVVGQIGVRQVVDLEPATSILHLRIVKAIYDEDDNSFATFEDDLTAGDDANSPFLWERHMNMYLNVDTLSPLNADPAWSHIDIRVNRKLERDEALFLLYQYEAPSTLNQVIMRLYLRSWVTRTR